MVSETEIIHSRFTVVVFLVMKFKCQNVEMCVRLLHPMTLTSNINEYLTDDGTKSIVY